MVKLNSSWKVYAQAIVPVQTTATVKSKTSKDPSILFKMCFSKQNNKIKKKFQILITVNEVQPLEKKIEVSIGNLDSYLTQKCNLQKPTLPQQTSANRAQTAPIQRVGQPPPQSRQVTKTRVIRIRPVRVRTSTPEGSRPGPSSSSSSSRPPGNAGQNPAKTQQK